jgi:hypothetical protein
MCSVFSVVDSHLNTVSLKLCTSISVSQTCSGGKNIDKSIQTHLEEIVTLITSQTILLVQNIIYNRSV